MSEVTRSSKRHFRPLGRGALIGVEIAVPLLILGSWFFGSASSSNPFYPPLALILTRFRELWIFDRFASDILPSLGNLIAGFGVGVVLGVVIGVVISLVRPIGWICAPVLDFWRAIPPVALVPIVVSLAGFGNETRIVTIALSAIFPTLIATIDALRSVDPQLDDVSRVYRLTRAEKLFRVSLPAASPRIASGMQVSLQVAFVVMIASEMLGTSYGIGALTLLAQQSFAISDMWAGILLLGVIGFAANFLFDLARNRVLRWYVRSQKMGRDI